MADVSVDDDFARFGAKSYAINKINSVEVRERQPYGRGGAILCGLLCLFAIMAGWNSLGAPDGPSGSSFVLAIFFAGLAYWLWQRANIREYLLFLMTSSSETQAFVTRSEDEVASLRERIEAAMSNHSQGGLRQP